MVIQNNKPKSRWVNTIEIPPKINQMMFIMVDKQPVFEEVFVILTPKGASPTIANLKHCTPKGMPIIVKHNTIPPKIY